MRIGLYHGYELTGSGSNEYTRYLSRALALLGHEVHVLCREPDPAAVDHVTEAFEWSRAGASRSVVSRRSPTPGRCVVHCLPHASVRPVFLTDKQRSGNVKAFVDLTDDELREVHDVNVAAVRAVLRAHPLDVLHANHLVYQPVAAVAAARDVGVPVVIFPHGSSIEYTLRKDPRFVDLARQALREAQGLIIGNEEVEGRLHALYREDEAELRAKTRIVGVGVDTSLFRPIARDEREAAAEGLASQGPFGGKSRELRDDLRVRVAGGEYDAVTEYRDAYDHSQPDADLGKRLRALPLDAPQLLFVGALTAGKGLQSLLAAMPALLETVPDAHLLIVGSGAYREVLEALVHALDSGDEALLWHLAREGFDLDRSAESGPWLDVVSHLSDDARRRILLDAGRGLAERVHFFGRLSHSQLKHVFPCADVAVFPSLVPEAYPLVLMESLANGVLPAVTDSSGFAQGLTMLEPLVGRSWVDRMRLPLEPEGRVAAIAERLASLLGDEALRGIGPHLRAVAVEHFDWGVKARQMVDAYRELVAPRSAC